MNNKKLNCISCNSFLEEGVNWRKTTLTRKCNICLSISRKEWYNTNKERIQKQVKEFRDANLETVMLNRARTKSKRLGIPFNLELTDIKIPEFCPIFGTKLVIGYKSPNNPSLDRIIPSKGYVKGNVDVISVRANSIKNDANPNELRRIADYLENLYATSKL